MLRLPSFLGGTTSRKIIFFSIVFSLTFNNVFVAFAASTKSSTASSSLSSGYVAESSAFSGESFSSLSEPSSDDIPSFIRGGGGNGKVGSPDSQSLSGAFTYDYKLNIPPGRNGMTPDVTLSYSNQARNEDSVFGYGWNVSIPYIERQNILGLEDAYSVPSHFRSSLSGELIPTEDVASTTVTFYPDASPGGTTFDGYTYGPGFGMTGGEVFSRIRGNDSVWGFSDTASSAFDWTIDGWVRRNGWNQYDFIGRTHFLFDTSSIPSYARIVDATFSVYSNGLVNPPGIDLNLSSTITGSTTAISSDDYKIANFGTTKLSDTSLNTSTWSAGYKSLILNAPGRQQVDRGGITRLSLRAAGDIENIDPALAPGANTMAGIYFSENGTSTRPKLVVTYNDTFPQQYTARNDDGSFLKYTFSNNSWIVNDKSGKTYYFGTSTTARIVDPNNSDKVSRWMLQKVTDTNGNSITYTYSKDFNQIYPDSISYTGSATSSGMFSIDFTKSLRATSTASTTATGFPVQTRYKIDKIEAKVSGSWVKKYDISYGMGDNGSRLILKSVTETGQAETGGTLTRPSTTFTYSTSTPTWNSVGWSFPTSNFVVNYQDMGVKLVDINGDGLPDIVKSFASSTATTTGVYLNTGSGWATSTSWGVKCAFSTMNSGNMPLDGGGRLVDVNGDILPDFICNNNIYLNTGSDWATSTVWASPELISVNNKDAGVRFADVNGDGLVDLVRGYYDDTSAQIYTKHVYLNNGQGWTLDDLWTVPTYFTTANGGDSGSRIEDVNGDGLADLIPFAASSTVPNSILINTGHSWSSSTTWTLPVNVSGINSRFVDINNDGLVDIAVSTRLTGSQWTDNRVYTNTGTGWILNDYWKLPVPLAQDTSETGTRFSDIDGDGVTDVISQGWGTYPYSWSSHQIYLGNGKVSDDLIRIDESAGGAITATYKGSAEYRDGSNNLLNPSLPATINTVQKLEYFDGINATSTQTFSYELGSYYYNNSTDRKFAGFGTSVKIDTAGNQIKTYFHQGNASATSSGEYLDNQSKIGRPYRIEARDNADNLYQLVVNKWESTDLGRGISFVGLGRTTTLDYDGDSDHKDKSEVYTYSTSTGSLLEKTEWGEVTGSSDGTFTDTGSDKRVTSITYAASSTGYLILPSNQTVLDQSGIKIAETKFYYDSLSLGSVSKGNLTKQESWKDSTNYVNTQKAYNSYGLPTQTTDARGKVTTYSYDSANLYVATSTNPLSQNTAFTYDYSSGKVTQTVDSNGYISQNNLDALDRVIEEKQPDQATPSTLVTKVVYSYTDNVIPRVIQKTLYLNSASSTDSYTYFDGLGRKLEERSRVEASNTYAVKDYTYDSRGNLQVESLPAFVTGTAYTGISSPANSSLKITYTYDPLNRVTTVANALGTTTNAYDDWKLTTTDSNGKIKSFYKDAYGRQNRVDEVAGSTYTTTYEYNGNNNLTKITDADSNVRNFTYDGLGRRLTAQDLHSTGDGTYGTWTYVYDDAGNMTSRVDPKSQTVNFTYDDVNRALTEDFTGTAGTEVSYGYDSCLGGKGKLCAATTTAAVTNYEYTGVGAVKKETRTIQGTNYVTQYAYDRLGNPTSIIYPDSSEVAYTYNAAGLPERVQRKESGSSFSDIVSNFSYSPTGKVSYKLFANGLESSYTYEPAKLYRLTNILTASSTGSNPLAIVHPGRSEQLYASVPLSGPFNQLAVNFMGRLVLDDIPSSSIEEGVVSPTEETVVAPVELATTTIEFVPSVEAQSVLPQEETSIKLQAELASTSARQVVPEIPLPVDDVRLKIKVPKEKILGTHASTRSLTYAYKTDTKVDEISVGEETIKKVKEKGLNMGNEVLEKRTRNARVFATSDPKTFVAEIVSGPSQYYQDKKGDWWLADYGTTTPESYEYQTKEKPGFFEQLMSFLVDNVFADTTSTFYPGTGGSGTFDGFTNGPTYSHANSDFSTVRSDSYVGEISDSVSSAFDWTSQPWIRKNSNGNYDYIGRTYFLFDTSSIPTNATISSATFSVYSNGLVSSPYIDLNISSVTTANTGSISSADRAVSNFGSTKLSDTSLNTSSWASGYKGFTLNSSGRDQITKGGVTSLSLRTVADIDDTSPGLSGEQNLFAGIYFAERSGTSNDPKLVIVYQISPLAPTDLLVDGQVNPIHVLSTPKFSAVYQDVDTGDLATHYEIQVATSTSFTSPYWDSTKTALSSSTPRGSRTPDMTYTGSALASSTTYYWRVKFWDVASSTGLWSTTTSSFELETVSGGSNIQDMSLSYDSVGNIVQINDYSNTQTYKAINFSYDDLYRLTLASTTQANTSAFKQAFVYGPTGNMLENRMYPSATSTYSYAGTNYANPHAATSIAGTALSYDNNGNLTIYGTKTYGWDYRNRIASSSTGVATTTYSYDHMNQRVLKVTGSATSTYINQYYDIASGTTTKYIYANGEPIATVTGIGGSAQVSYIHPDYLGSTNVVTDGSKAVVQALDYYPYGSIRVNAGTNQDAKKYIGQYYDDNSNLSYLNARYYDGDRGRFLSEDPVFWEIGQSQDGKALIMNPQAQNSYSYAGGNPVINKDVNGRYFEAAVSATLGFRSLSVGLQFDDTGVNLFFGGGLGIGLQGGIDLSWTPGVEISHERGSEISVGGGAAYIVGFNASENLMEVSTESKKTTVLGKKPEIGLTLGFGASASVQQKLIFPLYNKAAGTAQYDQTVSTKTCIGNCSQDKSLSGSSGSGKISSQSVSEIQRVVKALQNNGLLKK